MKVLLLVAGATEKIYLKNCVIQDLNIQQQGQLQRLTMLGVQLRHFEFTNNTGFEKIELIDTSFKKGKFLNNIGQAKAEIKIELDTETLSQFYVFHNHATKLILEVNGQSSGIHLRKNQFKEMSFINKESPHTSVFMRSA